MKQLKTERNKDSLACVERGLWKWRARMLQKLPKWTVPLYTSFFLIMPSLLIQLRFSPVLFKLSDTHNEMWISVWLSFDDYFPWQQRTESRCQYNAAELQLIFSHACDWILLACYTFLCCCSSLLLPLLLLFFLQVPVCIHFIPCFILTPWWRTADAGFAESLELWKIISVPAVG